MQAGLKEKRYKNPLEFLHVAGVMLVLSEYDLIDESQSDIAINMKNYMDDNLESGLNYELREEFRWGLTGYDGLGYPNQNIHFISIRDHLFNCYDRWKEKWLVGEAGPELLETMKEDFWVFGSQISIQETTSDQRFIKTPILKNIAVSDFIRAWLSLAIEEQYFMTGILQDRYKFEKHLIVEEKDWCLEVFKTLQKISKKEVIKPRRAQIKMLCEKFQTEVVPSIQALEKEDS